ncbi:MAG: hypothetical protein A2275_11090 [Bacteroidetes bacterium RIFOXYA12_FULL_35_11]|nr:MAG: hypothetical protein A2X01_16130 [Bacteroidetes bacterium GWF2_35_48]OFY77358.1 MAG: hypothetical protein A2275_11090 [Bacteroidetes bacterium RIFOXYA12_FULL_35_11]OFY96195.1 MAG: hypothetical protein A2309_01020 [Bacteroidetes bacterium RIFOXYB2_FULL_35_7]OFZ02973.1 MAG: hypothetical protein A2491_17790 [Bacteroidetes bacterium RIFOXYC12_FULL_35_7]HBX50904.1 hypothetical protein [Bacteroidales bacterium]
MQAIGKIIEKKLREKGMSVSEFARRIATNRNNAYDIFARKSVDTSLLLKISKVLDNDFFQYYITDETKTQIASDPSNQYTTSSEIKRLSGKIELLQKEILILEERLTDKDKIIELMKKVQK